MSYNWRWLLQSLISKLHCNITRVRLHFDYIRYEILDHTNLQWYFLNDIIIRMKVPRVLNTVFYEQIIFENVFHEYYFSYEVIFVHGESIITSHVNLELINTETFDEIVFFRICA